MSNVSSFLDRVVRVRQVINNHRQGRMRDGQLWYLEAFSGTSDRNLLVCIADVEPEKIFEKSVLFLRFNQAEALKATAF